MNRKVEWRCIFCGMETANKMRTYCGCCGTDKKSDRIYVPNRGKE